MKFGTSLIVSAGFAVLFLVTSLGCAEKQSQPKITINMSEKANGALAAEITNVFVNVSGPGGLQVFEWDCERESCEKFELNINQAGQSLIQLLAVTEDTTEITQLNYGDVYANLNGGNNPDIELAVSNIGSFSSEGRIIGRYIPKSGHTLAGKKLTGDLEMNVFVASGKPDMKLMKREIFAGWVHLMVLDNIGFKYIFNGYDSSGNSYSNVPLFDDLHNSNGLSLSSQGIQTNSNKIVHYDLNSDIYDERDGGLFTRRSFDKKIVGFFGANPDNKYFCAKPLTDATLFSGNDGGSRICKTVNAASDTCTSYYTWGEVRTDSTAPGVDGQSDTCTGATREFEVKLEDVGQGDDGLLDFLGPFVGDSSFNSGIADLDVFTRELKWKIGKGVHLPGGVAVYVSADVSEFDRHDIEAHGGILDCELLPSHFKFRKVVAASPGNISRYVIPSSFLNQYTGIALCPLRPDGSFYGSALVTDRHDSEGGAAAAMFEMALYYSGGSPVPDFAFGSQKWNDGSPFVAPPVSAAGTSQFTIVIKNRSSESITVDNWKIDIPVSGMTINPSPSTPPPGVAQCVSPGVTLQPAGSPGLTDRCAIGLDFNAATFAGGGGVSIHNGFTAKTSLVSDPSSEDWVGFPLIEGTFLTKTYTNTVNIDLFAPFDEFDVKHVMIDNTSGGPWDLGNMPLNDSMWGDYTVKTDCPVSPATLPDMTQCFLTLIFYNGGGMTDGSFNDGAGLDLGGSSSGTIDSYYYSGGPSFSGNTNFGSIPGDSSQVYTLLNNSTGAIDIFSSDVVVTTSHGASTNYFDDPAGGPPGCHTGGPIQTLAGATSCETRVNIYHDPGLGQRDEWFYILYNIGDTYRVIEHDLLIFHQ